MPEYALTKDVPPAREPEPPASGLSLQEYLMILRRRRYIIIQAFLLITVIGIVITLLTRPVYQASAELLVDGPSYNSDTVDTSNPLSDLMQLDQEQTADTQVQVLETTPLLNEVTQQVGPAQLAVSIVDQDTNVIQDQADAATPQRAADAANRLLELYVQQDSDQSLAGIQQAAQFVQTQGAVARKNLNNAEAALADFSQQYHISDLATNRADQIARISALTDQYNKTQTDLAAIRAQIAATRALIASEPATVPFHLANTNTEVSALRDQIRALKVQRDGMTQPGGYTSKAPQVQALDAQIAELNQQLAHQPILRVTESSDPNANRQSLMGQLADSQAQAAALVAQAAKTRQQLAQAQQQVGKYAGLQVILDRLTRRQADAQTQDANFTSQLEDLTLRAKARHVSARIIEYATPNPNPIRPKKFESILFSALIGLFVGLCLALLQEFLDDRINTTEDADRTLGLPSLGHVPALTATDARLLPHMKGMDPAAESYRILRTNINFASIDAPLRTLVVTSSTPGEGKTTTAANLAFAMAADGRRVILVDTDLRRPSIHKLLELPVMPGLTDVLLGKIPLQDALLDHDQMTGLSVLTCGSTPPNPSELLGSRTFRNLVTEMMELADLVIFDSPPVLAAADAQILASQMDGTVLVVESGSTKKAAARRTLELLRQARATLLGVAYNKMRQMDANDYYYYQYYHASLKEEAAVAKDAANLLPSPPKEENE